MSIVSKIHAHTLLPIFLIYHSHVTLRLIYTWIQMAYLSRTLVQLKKGINLRCKITYTDFILIACSIVLVTLSWGTFVSTENCETE